MSDANNMNNPENSREKAIVRTSIIGIIANVLLAGFKAVVGLLSNSIAIVLDAVNNLSDAASSAITIIGTKLAGKAPDRKHPFGYGRIEYITTIIIAVIVLWAGITSLSESIQRIINPEVANYEAVTLIIVAVAVVAKLILGRYVKTQGIKLDADSLIASGTDATMDAVISASTLVAAFIFMFTGVGLEAWLGAIISIVIIKAGIDILREALGKILGERVDAELSQKIKDTVAGVQGVNGAYDLVLNDYGPNSLSGSIHIAVNDTLTASQLDTLTRDIQSKVMCDHGVMLHTIGVYSTNTLDKEIVELEQDVMRIINSHDNILQVHGFYVDEAAKTASVDIIISFDEKDRMGLYRQIAQEIESAYPQYKWRIALDTDVSD